MDYEMCVHVFGGTSSPGCCNYALTKTVVDNASDFNVGVAETLKKKSMMTISSSLLNLRTQQSNSYKMLEKSVSAVVST